MIEYRQESHGSEPVTVTAITRSTASVPHEATGADYEAAYAAYRATIPERYVSLGVGVEHA